MKRNLILGAQVKQPEWMLLKINAILLKDRVFIDGDTTDETKHYTRRASTQIQMTKYSGNPLMRGDIEVIPATNDLFNISQEVPINDNSGWHATIDAQVFGLDEGSVEIDIENQ
jgi:hypothetical protein